MFRLTVRQFGFTTKQSVQLRTVPNTARLFSSGILAFKKAKKGGKLDAKQTEEPTTEEDPTAVIPQLEQSFKESIDQFKKKTNETKQGNSNSKIFDQLEVPVNHKETSPFTSVAQTSLKGRNLIITVFDPNNVKHVVSSVLSSGLNMNPQTVPNFPQQLKVALPPPTAETRKEIAAALKKDFEHFKQSPSKHSLSSARANALKELKAFEKNDKVKKVSQDVEKLHKKYVEELQKQFKTAEKSVLN
jgi:ribosome recycling factor